MCVRGVSERNACSADVKGISRGMTIVALHCSTKKRSRQYRPLRVCRIAVTPRPYPASTLNDAPRETACLSWRFHLSTAPRGQKSIQK